VRKLHIHVENLIVFTLSTNKIKVGILLIIHENVIYASVKKTIDMSFSTNYYI